MPQPSSSTWYQRFVSEHRRIETSYAAAPTGKSFFKHICSGYRLGRHLLFSYTTVNGIKHLIVIMHDFTALKYHKEIEKRAFWSVALTSSEASVPGRIVWLSTETAALTELNWPSVSKVVLTWCRSGPNTNLDSLRSRYLLVCRVHYEVNKVISKTHIDSS